MFYLTYREVNATVLMHWRMEQNDYLTLNAERDVLVINPRFVVEKGPYRCSIIESEMIKMVIKSIHVILMRYHSGKFNNRCFSIIDNELMYL